MKSEMVEHTEVKDEITEHNTNHGEITYSESYTEAMHSAHYPAMLISELVAVIGIFFAFVFYQWKKVDVEKLVSTMKPLYTFSLNKWYFDEFYNKTFVAGLLGFSNLIYWFDSKIIDGIVNGSATITRAVSTFTGGFDKYVVDGLVNLMAYLSGFFGLLFRRLQTGKVQTYIVLVIFSIIIFFFFF